jgi:hypothetical protein
MGRTWETPTIEVGDTVFLLFGDGIAAAESIVYVQRMAGGAGYIVKFDTNETMQFEPPMFEDDDTSDVEP